MFKTPFKENFADWKSEIIATNCLLIPSNHLIILNSLSEWEVSTNSEIIPNNNKAKDASSYKNTQKEAFILKEKSSNIIPLDALEKNNNRPKLKHSCSDSNLYLLKNKETHSSKLSSYLNLAFDIDKLNDNKVQNSFHNEILRLKSLYGKMNNPTTEVSKQVNTNKVSTTDASNSLCFNQEKNLLSSKYSLELKPPENKFIQQNFQTTEQHKLNGSKSTLDSSVQVDLIKTKSLKNAMAINLRKINTFVPLNKSEDFNTKDGSKFIKQHEKRGQLLDNAKKIISVKRKLDFLSTNESCNLTHPKQTSNKEIPQTKPSFKRRLFDDNSCETSAKKSHLESKDKAKEKDVDINFTPDEIKSMLELIQDSVMK